MRSLLRLQHPLAWRVVEGRRICVERGHASEKHEANAVPELRLKRQFAN